MASRHDIINITFQANAGKANVALQALQGEAKKSSDRVKELKQKLKDGWDAHLPADQLQKIQDEIRKAEKDTKQWNKAYKDLIKGVRTIDEAVKQFNAGTMGQMNAAFNKTAANAAKLAQTKMMPGTQEWKEMDALIVEAQSNVLKATADINGLVSAIKQGGTSTKSTLTQAKTDLQQLLLLEVRGSTEWRAYNDQLKAVEGELAKLAQAERQAAQADQIVVMNKRMSNLKMLSDDALAETRRFWEQMIAGSRNVNVELEKYKANLKEVIDQERTRKAESAIKVLSNMKGSDIESVRSALQVMTRLRDTTQEGTDKWRSYNIHVKEGKAYLAQYAESEKIARGEAMSLANALKLSASAGGRGFQGTAQQLQLAEQALQKAMQAANKGSEEWRVYKKALARVRMEQSSVGITSERMHEILSRPINADNLDELSAAVKRAKAELNLKSETVGVNNKEYQELAAQIKEAELQLKEMQGEAMSLANALKLSASAGGRGFQGTAQQLQLAEQALQKAMQTAIKGSEEWMTYKDALARVRMEQSSIGITSERMHEILSRPVNAKNLNELSAAVKRAKAELNLMSETVGVNNKEYQELAAQTKKAELQLKQMQGAANGTTTSFERAFSRLKTYIGLYMGAGVAIQKVMSSLGDVMDMSDKMGEVRKTTGFTSDEVSHLSKNLAKLDTRTSINGLLELSAAAGQLGLKSESDVEGFTEAANKLMVALPEMGKEGATQMLKIALATGEIDKIQRQMADGSIQGSSAVAVAMEKVGSTIDRLRASSASTAPAITDFVQRVGAVGAQSGISIHQVAALGSTVDSLGMRVEMSATALSRMIPAIRANAFDIAKAIGVTPDTLRNLFDTGRGMEAILMIFQHIKDSGMDADSIENMLGIGSMKDIMKELDQQGARAGIVFSGLSQNVDELRRQLGVADEAYEQNIAIQQEYDKMNETTEAKWERLKNQISEQFVTSEAQRFFGIIIDALRSLVDFITGNVSPVLQIFSDVVKTAMIAWAVFKMGIGEALFIKSVSGIKSIIDNVRLLGMYIGDQIKLTWALITAKTADERASIKAAMANKGLNASMMANVWFAVAAAIVYACVKLYEWIDAQKEGSREAARFNAELQKEQAKAEKLTNSIAETRVKMEDANKEVAKATAALSAAKKAADGSAESNRRLTAANAALIEAEEKKHRLMAAQKQLVEKFNQDYGKYLGFMLSEVSSNIELARARDLVNSKLRESIILKRKEAALERIEKKYGGNRDEKYADLDYVLDAIKDPIKRAKLKMGITRIAYTSSNEDMFKKKFDNLYNGLNFPSSYSKGIAYAYANDYYHSVKEISDKNKIVEQQNNVELSVNRQDSQRRLYGVINAAISNYRRKTKIYYKTKGKAKSKAASDLLKILDELNELKDNSSSYFDMNNPHEAAAYRKNITNQLIPFFKYRESFRSELEKKAGTLYKPRKTMTNAGGSGSNGQFTPSKNYTSSINTSPWGSHPESTSTDYASWNVEELVKRRNQMDKFKNVLKPGVQVREVLAEDKALMKAFRGKKDIDWKSALDWYNAERKKIQKELQSERFSTNQGHWRDETIGKGKKKRTVRRNRFQESDYALAELDRYYSRRKEALEKARAAENISEELYNRQTERLEQEHLERRAKLRGTFTGEISKKETIAFRKWWDDLNKNNELDKVPWGTVESEWSKATVAQIGLNNLRMQKDMTEVSTIMAKYVNEITQIIAKERPFNGLTDNLEDNLTKMDLLFADMGLLTKEQLNNGSMQKEKNKRLSFLLGESENAYSLTSDQLIEDMQRNGYDAWANAINSTPNSDEMKRQILAQLRKTYDAIQEAIKKEAAVIKKQVEVWWADIVPGQQQSNKDVFEKALAALGLEEEQVKRVNQLIGAGYHSEQVADKLAIKQLQVRLQMQQTYYNKMREIGLKRKNQLQEEANQLRNQAKSERAKGNSNKADNLMGQVKQKEIDANNIGTSLNLAEKEEQKTITDLQNQLQKETEESAQKLYTHLKEWAGLFSQSMKGIFEATHTGDAQYYNDRAKLNLTGKGGPGAGTYIITDKEGTSEATAHYEFLDEREALERQHQIEHDNAMADAWKKVFDEFNAKLSEEITDYLNSMLQTQALDANTQALVYNAQQLSEGTAAVTALTREIGSNKPKTIVEIGEIKGQVEGSDKTHIINGGGTETFLGSQGKSSDNSTEIIQPRIDAEEQLKTSIVQNVEEIAQANINADNTVTEAKRVNNERLNTYIVGGSNTTTKVITNNTSSVDRKQKETDNAMANSSKKTFAAMTAAANMYGIAYQAMSNENLSTTQKVELMIVQAAGQALISMLTAQLAADTGATTSHAPSWISNTLSQLGPIGAPVAIGVFTALIGGLMGLAVSKISKSKSTIAQVTGASTNAGRLATGMLTYATGNVNEFTDPSTLTQGRQYNVDAADGHTYRARYMGSNPRTHITSGPEFHLTGERGHEMIIDADTTRQITMNDNEIWRTIKTLSSGGNVRRIMQRSGGMPVFAEGNVADFAGYVENNGSIEGIAITSEQAIALQLSIDRQSDLLERALTEGIKGVFNVHGPDGLVANYDRGKKAANRHGERY